MNTNNSKKNEMRQENFAKETKSEIIVRFSSLTHNRNQFSGPFYSHFRNGFSFATFSTARTKTISEFQAVVDLGDRQTTAEIP